MEYSAPNSIFIAFSLYPFPMFSSLRFMTMNVHVIFQTNRICSFLDKVELTDKHDHIAKDRMNVLDLARILKNINDDIFQHGIRTW